MENARRISFCALSELRTEEKVTKWVDELKDELTALLLDGKVIVTSSVCLHMGGEFNVNLVEKKFCCRWHGWEFDVESGECLTFSLPGRRLPHYATTVEDGVVYLLIPRDADR